MSSVNSGRLEVADFQDSDTVIAVVGLAGAGKSTFINLATGKDILDVNNNSTRNTRTVQCVGYSKPERYGDRRVIFVEAPGFDSERHEGAVREILKTWLNQLSRQNLKVSGILYLHRITDTELWVTPPAHHLDMLRSLCNGSVGAFPNRMMMVTTMWDIIKPTQFNEASLKEAKIQIYWDQLSKGNTLPKVQRFERTFDSATSIVLALLGGKENDDWQESEVEPRYEHVKRGRQERLEKERLEHERKWLDRLERKEKEHLERKQKEWLGHEREWLERLEHEERERVDDEREWIRRLERDERGRLEREERERRERVERDRLKYERMWLKQLEHEERERLERERERLERLQREEVERVGREKKRYEDEERGRLRRLCVSRLSELMPHRHGLSLKLKRALANLPSNDSQLVVDFLNQVMDEHTLEFRKRLLYFFTEVVKLTQVFPRCFELTQAPCDLTKLAVRGAFSDVYHGRLHDPPGICVKAVRTHSSEMNLRAHAGVFALSAHALHRNILPIFGVYQSREAAFSRICLIFPWSKGGNLAEYLKDNPKTLSRVPLLVDVISGLHYLHQRGIIHCDLNATNVLVSATGQAMLSLSTITRVDGSYTATTDHPGTINWMAPELLTTDELPHYTEASDIWAFGCTCYEVMTGKTPFEEYTDALQLIPAFVQHKIDPSKLKPTPNATGIWELVDECLNLDPEHRPPAEKAKSFLTCLNVDDSRSPGAAISRLDFMEYRSSLPVIDYGHLQTILLHLIRTK